MSMMFMKNDSDASEILNVRGGGMFSGRQLDPATHLRVPKAKRGTFGIHFRRDQCSTRFKSSRARV